MRLRFLALAAVAAAAAWFPSPAMALFEEEAGSIDFLVATAGHRITKFSHIVTATGDADSLLVTSDSGSFSPLSSSCYVACRSAGTGHLKWRRRVCSGRPDADGSHAVAVSDEAKGVYTADSSGVVRAWSASDGALLWEVRAVETSAPISFRDPRVWTVTNMRGETIVFASVLEVDAEGSTVNDLLTVVASKTGSVIDRKDAIDALDHSFLKPKKGQQPRWAHFLPQPTRVGAIEAIVAFVEEGAAAGSKVAVGNRMALLELDVNVAHNLFTMGQNRHLSFIRAPISVDAFHSVTSGDMSTVVALSADKQKVVSFSTEESHVKEIAAASLDETWDEIYSVQPHPLAPSAIGIVGGGSSGESADSMIMVRASDGKPVIESAGSNTATASCSTPGGKTLAVVLNSKKPFGQVYIDSKEISVNGEIEGLASYIDDFGSVEHMKFLSCTGDNGAILVSTRSGTTVQLTVDIDGSTAKLSQSWTQEDGLSGISSALILDASHGDVNDSDDKDLTSQLALGARLKSQWVDMITKASGLLGDGSKNDFSKRDYMFGFVKVTVMLSQASGKIWGMNTVGKRKGSIRWALNLPSRADWHTLVYGSTNAPKAVHGIHGGTHGHDMLVLSAFSDERKASWYCVDGISGTVHTSGVLSISSPIVQVLPMQGGSSGDSCRQMTVFLHADESISIAPDDESSRTAFKHHLKSTPNGLFAHWFDKSSNKIESFHLSAQNDDASELSTQLIGRTMFTNERILSVSYPSRDEVIQSMCTVLGDESLLLKYINPHLSVVVTTSNVDKEEKGPFASALSQKLVGNQRKPRGVTESSTDESEPKDSNPNMFINIVDTVTGRVLHRASHINADPNGSVASVITENWIVYSFMNSKTRRTELGVLTLHEGMIDKKGITAFTSPEQTSSFSSLDPRESKPVVLSKTYTFPKTVSALGATSTRGGISKRKILIASTDGRISAVDRKMLETRRPMGQLKEAEKTEGLFQYTELIPAVSFMALTYNQTVESVRSIISTPTSLESQSLVFAFGGPDLFFTRVSPSRGFDLLPDSFSRILVSIVVVGLMAVLFMVQRMSKKKSIKEGWM